MDFLKNKKVIFIVIFIFIFIILAAIHAYNIKDIIDEKFITLTEEQNVGNNRVSIFNTDLVTFNRFGTDNTPKTLTNLLNGIIAKNTENTTKINNLETTISTLQTNLTLSIANNVPELTVVSYTGSITPIGWQLCDGALLTFANSTILVTTSYANISNFSHLKKSGSNYLTPALIGRFILGVGAGSGLTTRLINDMGGNETHTLSKNEMPSHNHGTDNYAEEGALAGNNCYNDNRAGGLIHNGGQWHKSCPRHHQHDFEGGGAAHNNMPPYYVLTYIIKQPIKK